MIFLLVSLLHGYISKSYFFFEFKSKKKKKKKIQNTSTFFFLIISSFFLKLILWQLHFLYRGLFSINLHLNFGLIVHLW